MADVSTPLGSFADWQLSRSSTPRRDLGDLVHRATGSSLIAAERILQGYSNEVYRVRCADGQDVAVRILRFDDDVSVAAAAAEAAAIGRARAVGVPAPEILLLDAVAVDGIDFPVMVQRAAAGQPLGRVFDRLSDRQRHDVLAETGGLIARINSIPVEGKANWSTTMAAELSNRYAERDAVIAGGISGSELDRIFGLLERYISEFPGARWVLCHGDLSLKHIFVTAADADGMPVRVSGIIDFGDWTPGASVHDLAVFRAREPQVDVAPLLSGYGAPTDRQFRRRLDLHTLLLALGSLAFGVEEGDRSCVTRSAAQIRTLLGCLVER